MKNFLTSITFILAILLSGTQLSQAAVVLTGIKHSIHTGADALNRENKNVQSFEWPFLTSESAVSMMPPPCPDNQTIQLASGECGVTVPSFGFSFPALPPVADITTNPNLNSTTINSTIYCSTGQTKYSRVFYHGGPTDMRIKTINIGVYKSVNAPLVTVNFYTSPGNVLLGTYTTSVPDINKNIFSFNIPAGVNIKIPALTSYKMEIVTNAPYISEFLIGRNNGNNVTGFSEANVVSDICPSSTAFSEIVDSGTPTSIVFSVIGTPDDYRYINNLINSYEEGDFFPIGPHPMSFNVIDANGTVRTCVFNINVLEAPTTTGALVCNDQVQVSLGEDCETIVTPDMILEGEGYGCYNKYKVQIIANNGVNLGNKVTSAHIGQKLKTQIIGPNGNSCWGEILVEDKLGPELVCEDIYTTCSTDLSPGSPISERVPVVANILDGTIASNGINKKSFTIPVADLKGTTITDLNVFIDVTHSNVSDLAANITSPDGVTVPLFFDLGCDGQNLMVTLDDESNNINELLETTCELANPAVAGTFKPYNPLSIFDGKPLEGNWVVTIFDGAASNGGTVNNIHLIFSQEGGVMSFPVENAGTFTQISDDTYRVEGADNCGPATLTYKDVIVEENCLGIYSKIIKRCWTGSDLRGNAATPCCQNIYVYRNSLSTLVFPPNFDGINGNPLPLSCVKYGDTIPPVSVTGLPHGDLCQNVQIVDPTDIRIDICENSYKLLRTHKVIEWCSGQVIVHNQIIKVLDNQGPVLTCPNNVTISTDNYSCTATYKVPRPTIGLECSENLQYYLSYNNFNAVDSEFVDDNVNALTGEISGLVFGDNWIKWVVTDACDNTSECTFKVHVRDNVLPNAVCDQFTIASISGDGRAVVDASTFDDGSTDNCGIFKFEARKMTDTCHTGSLNFGTSVTFCCTEVNTSIMVEFRVTDIYGNSNTCMVEVKVQDKLPPFITKCPADITLDCQADYTDLSVTKIPEFIDNCSAKLDSSCNPLKLPYCDDVKINQCGVGTVTRKWTVIDKQGYKNSCIQVITLVDKNPFKSNEIVWPENYETNKCFSNLDPAFLPAKNSVPTYSDDNCSLVAAHYKDQIFKFVDGACEKVIRTWTVIDWCTYNEQNPVYNQGWYEHIQIIKLRNDVAPQFVGPSGTTVDGCVDRTIPVYGSCEGPVEFAMSAIDDCPENNVNLLWKYELYTETGLTPIAVANSSTFSRVLTAGTYRLRWTVEDKCGNRAFCTHNLNVVESKKPTPYCLSSITTAVMNSDGTIAIWAKDYDLGAYDNCTPKDQLWFTFFGATPVDSLAYKEHYFKGDGILATKAEYLAGNAQIWKPDTKSSGILFDCDDIANGISQEVSVEVWVTDLAGNQDYCTVTIVLQDNANVCPNNNQNLIVISGKAALNGKPVSGADVNLQSTIAEQNKSLKTDVNGGFSFAGLPKSSTYTVSMTDNRNLLNGVSTLDLVMIQRHILGLESFNDPKKVIAADVDNNSKVTAADLVTLRKNILGITIDFPNGQKSWRFVTANHVFTDPAQPFPFTEKYVFNQLTENKVNQNFQAIKIGDVNQSATTNVNDPSVESRGKQSLEMEVDYVLAQAGQTISVPVYGRSFQNILGYQGTMEFDGTALTLSDIHPGVLDVSDVNFGLQNADRGFITTSWNREAPVSVDASEPLFTLIFNLKKDIDSYQVLKMTSGITPAIAYDNLYNVLDVSIGSRSKNSHVGFVLHQNIPNPFNDKTMVTFELPESMSVRVTVSDMTGKIVKVISGQYTKGSHNIELSAAELGVSGVLFYKIESGKYTDTKKMILVD